MRTTPRKRPRQDPAWLRCPWCHETLGGGARAACARCATSYHEECARETRRCALLGCGGAVSPSPEKPSREPLDRDALQDAAFRVAVCALDALVLVVLFELMQARYI